MCLTGSSFKTKKRCFRICRMLRKLPDTTEPLLCALSVKSAESGQSKINAFWY
jgi:hypothetical protein